MALLNCYGGSIDLILFVVATSKWCSLCDVNGSNRQIVPPDESSIQLTFVISVSGDLKWDSDSERD